jgi:predicted secreted protein
MNYKYIFINFVLFLTINGVQASAEREAQQPKRRCLTCTPSRTIQRSKKVFFLSECIVNQNIRAQGVQNIEGDGPVSAIVQLLTQRGVGFTIVDCPELYYEGLQRRACGKDRYENEQFREICRSVIVKMIARYKMYLADGYKVGGFICINGSPTCAVDFCFRGKGKCSESGVFVEELKKELEKANLGMALVGYDKWNVARVLSRISQIIDGMDA